MSLRFSGVIQCTGCRRSFEVPEFVLVTGHIVDECRACRGSLHDRRRAANIAWMRQYKERHPCVRCGERFPSCLTFHHLNPAEKTDAVSQLAEIGVPLDVLKQEIGKTIILCLNCHVKTHAEQKEATA